MFGTARIWFSKREKTEPAPDTFAGWASSRESKTAKGSTIFSTRMAMLFRGSINGVMCLKRMSTTPLGMKRTLTSGIITRLGIGEYYDSELKTIYLRARNYNAATGRFLTEDPAGDGANWYAYCANEPVGFVDPSGMEGLPTIYGITYADGTHVTLTGNDAIAYAAERGNQTARNWINAQSSGSSFGASSIIKASAARVANSASQITTIAAAMVSVINQAVVSVNSQTSNLLQINYNVASTHPNPWGPQPEFLRWIETAVRDYFDSIPATHYFEAIVGRDIDGMPLTEEERWEEVGIGIEKSLEALEDGLMMAGTIKKVGGGVGNNTPGNNQAQNKQARDAAKKHNLSEEGRGLLHRRIGGQDYGYQEILEEAASIAEMGGKYVR